MDIASASGFEVLTAMEKVPVGDEDRPQQQISITGATVFVNPYKDEEEEERKAAEKVGPVCWLLQQQIEQALRLPAQQNCKPCPEHHACCIVLKGIEELAGLSE